MNESEDLMLQALAAAVDVGGVPIIMIPYDGPPPNAEFFLDMMRHMITVTGEATGCITFGTSDGSSGMFPLMEIDPQSGLGILIQMREAGAFGSVSWVTIASDTYRRTFEDINPDDVQRGDLELMRLLGDGKVEDVLMALCVAPDGPGYDEYQSYVKTDDGIEWGDVQSMPQEGTSSGPLVDLMRVLVSV